MLTGSNDSETGSEIVPGVRLGCDKRDAMQKLDRVRAECRMNMPGNLYRISRS